MGRYPLSQEPDLFGESVVHAFVMTNHEQRTLVAEDWESGNKTLYKEYAKLLEINAEGLLVAALLEVEHPSICKPGGRPVRSTYTGLLNMVMNRKPEPRKCSKCGETKDETEFSKYKYKAQSWCRDCHRKYTETRRSAFTLEMDEYKADHGCADCGEKNPKILEFHHVEKKSFPISKGYTKDWVEVVRELRKCVVLCKKCHKERHKKK